MTSGKAQVPAEQEWDRQDALLPGPDCSSSDMPPDVLLVTVNIFEALLLFLSLLYLIFKKKSNMQIIKSISVFVVFFGEAVINGVVFSKITYVPC